MVSPRPLSDLERVSQGFLSQLAAQESGALVEVAKAYKVAAKALTTEWQKAYRVLQAAKAAGFDANYLSGFIWREQRLASMLASMQAIFEPVGRATGVAINQTQQRAIMLAQQSFTQSMALATGIDAPSVTATLGLTFPQASYERMVSHLTDGSPINNLAARYGSQGPNVVREALLAGVANGESPRVVARRINKALGGMYGNASLMTRTEMMRVYRESTRATYLANARYVKGWIWSSALDARTCPICFAMHGTKHALSEPMASHPACRCSMTPDIIFRHLAPLPDPKLGTEVFRGLPEDMQREILGPLAFRAYQQGRIDLPDLVRETWHPQWGAGRAQRSLSSLIGPDGVAGLRAGNISKALPKPTPAAPMPKVLKPKGTPVSSGLDMSGLPKKGKSGALADEMRAAAQLIDQTHGDGGLPGVPVGLDQSSQYYGVYRHTSGYITLPDGTRVLSRKPVALNLSKVAQVGPSAQPRMTFVHETGHYLDQQFLAPRITGKLGQSDGHASVLYPDHPGIKAWREAVHNTSTYKRIEELKSKARTRGTIEYIKADGTKGTMVPDYNYVTYMLKPQEEWARSYAQYVATKTKDPAMRAELAYMRDPAKNPYLIEQWSDDEFEPIAKAIDDLLEMVGALE
jgi:SPP1 gp7 family putative phage head morphogenesis protein